MDYLIVEQDVVARKILAIMLKHFGDCQAATDGEEAIAMFTRSLAGGENCYAVFLEMMYAVETDLLRKLRAVEAKTNMESSRRTRYVIVGTLPESDAMAFLFEKKVECDAYLTKPISPEVLEKEIRQFHVEVNRSEFFDRQRLATLMIDVGDKEIVRELISKFDVELPEKMQDMQNQLQHEGYDDVKKTAHKLITISGTYGFTQLAEVFRSIEQNALMQNRQAMESGIELARQQHKQVRKIVAALLER